MIKAIAFDPGKTTGFAIGEIDSHLEDLFDTPDAPSLVYDPPMLVQTAQAPLTHKDIFEFITNYAPNYIICERFDFRNKARSGLELISREFIGVVELYCQLNPDCTLVMQPAGPVISGHFDQTKLRKLKLYRSNQIHANEACMHLCYWGRFGSGFQYCKGEFQAKNDITNPLFK